MAMSDPIADMLTRIRNAVRNGFYQVDCLNSKVCQGIAQTLQAEGYVASYELLEDGKQGILRIQLQYGPNGEQLINRLKRESRPGRRVYKKVKELPRPLAGLGIAVISTPRGVMSDRQARAAHVGGEWLCTVE
jgi:small subunit ribosomal protein S8